MHHPFGLASTAPPAPRTATDGGAGIYPQANHRRVAAMIRTDRPCTPFAFTLTGVAR